VVPHWIPSTLKALPQWVPWDLELRDGKWAKIPKNPRNGENAKANDAGTWGTFEEAFTFHQAHGTSGIGFEFSAAHPFVGIDLDDCRDPDTGDLTELAQEMLARFTTYAEISPSGTGIKLIGIGRLPASGKNFGNIEVYDRGRYFALTGERLQGCPAEPQPCQEALDELLERLKPKGPPSATRPAMSDDRRRLIERAQAYVRREPPAISGSGGHNQAFHVACILVEGFALTDDEAREILKEWNQTCVPPWSDRELDHKLADARAQIDPGRLGYLANRSLSFDQRQRCERRAADSTQSWDGDLPLCTFEENGHPVEPDDNHELITIDAGNENLAEVTAQAWQALQATNNPPTLFRYGALPSRIERDDDGAPILRPMTNDRMRHRLARAANWFKVDRKGNEIPAAPPMAVVRDVLATPDPDLPILTRIVEAPIFAADGSLCAAPGYSSKSKTFFAPAPGFMLPSVSIRPTRAEIADARDLLMIDLIGDFPFVSEADKAHALAAAFGPFVRDMIEGPAPLHDFEAPSPGTGKTLLVDLLTHPALGRSIAAMTEGRDEDEWRKRLFAKLRTAPAVLLLDNIKRRFDSGAVSSAITAYPLWEDRILGVSEIARVPVRTIWIMTANNPALSSEIARRTIRIRLDAKIDRPWLRQEFRHADIRAWAWQNRARLVWAVLTLVQSWIAAGRPEGSRTLGMFERWAKVIGGILDVSGIPGFLGNLADFYEQSDAEGSTLRGFAAAWWATHRTNAVTVAALLPLAIEAGLDLGEKGEQSQKIRLGKLLTSTMRDRVFNVTQQQEHRLRVEAGGTDHRATLWRLVPLPQEGSPR
jgi:hypothetical protein